MAWFSVQLQLHDRTLSRWISPREAQQKIESGEAIKVPRKAHQPFAIIRLKKPVDPSKSPDSPCSITCTDMLVNAGVIERSRFRVELLHAKIDHFKPFPIPIVEAVIE